MGLIAPLAESNPKIWRRESGVLQDRGDYSGKGAVERNISKLRAEGQRFDCATWVHNRSHAEGSVQAGGGEATDRAGEGTVGDYLLQGYKSQIRTWTAEILFEPVVA